MNAGGAAATSRPGSGRLFRVFAIGFIVGMLVACSASTSVSPSAGSPSTPASTPGATPSPTPCPAPPLSLGMALTVEDPTWSRCDIDGLATCPREGDGSVRFVNAERAGRLQTKPMSATVDLSLVASTPSSIAPSTASSVAPSTPSSVTPIPPQPGMDVQLVLVVNLLAPSAVTPGAMLASTSGELVARDDVNFVTWLGQGVLAEVAPGGESGRVTFVDLPVAGEVRPDWPDRLSGEVTWRCP